jgi:protein-S-isoprenylcysteine O-methyltransferase Ste14
VLRIFIYLGNIGVPGTALLLNLIRPRGLEGWIFTIFLFGHAFERVWETFFTSRERRRYEYHGDWSLLLVTSAYLVLCFFIIFEFFLLRRAINLWIVALGLTLYLVAYRLRCWGMASLGKQWAIHAAGAKKIRHVRLIRLGPYKFIRHPVYLGIMLEAISLALLPSCYFSSLFAIFGCVPFVILRAFTEERYAKRRFGSVYLQYKKEIPMFIPLTSQFGSAFTSLLFSARK